MSSSLGISNVVPRPEVLQYGQVFNARPISVEEYDQMIAQGILTDKDQVELLNGVIIEKITKGTRHASTNDRLNRVLFRLLGDTVVIRNQNPIWLSELSEPEPELVLAKFDEGYYSDRHPVPEDVLLIIEIGRDRYTKGAAYAAAGIEQYVLLNLLDETVEDYRLPETDGYGSKQTYHRGESFSLAAFPGITVNVDDLF